MTVYQFNISTKACASLLLSPVLTGWMQIICSPYNLHGYIIHRWMLSSTGSCVGYQDWQNSDFFLLWRVLSETEHLLLKSHPLIFLNFIRLWVSGSQHLWSKRIKSLEVFVFNQCPSWDRPWLDSGWLTSWKSEKSGCVYIQMEMKNLIEQISPFSIFLKGHVLEALET